MSKFTQALELLSDEKTKPSLLIVDDNPTNVELMTLQLKPYPYEIFKAYNGEEALDIIKNQDLDLILLDLMMPGMSGYEVCQRIKSNPLTQFIPVIIVTALRDLDDKLKAINAGADDFLIKPYNKIELTTRIKSLLRIKELHNNLDCSEDIVFALAEALEAKDEYTRGHSERVAHYSFELGRALGMQDLDIDILRKGSLLHDIGKVGVKDNILNKEGRLTADELAHIREHPVIGYEICKGLKSFKKQLPVIRWHHERMDGRGYPDGLKGEEIPYLARICCITDSYDAMTSDRPYRKGISPEQAANIFEREMHSGQWDPDILKVFIDLIRNQALEKAS